MLLISDPWSDNDQGCKIQEMDNCNAGPVGALIHFRDVVMSWSHLIVD
jgi:hypothetical protein